MAKNIRTKVMMPTIGGCHHLDLPAFAAVVELLMVFPI
jgi:hypothetical protein